MDNMVSSDWLPSYIKATRPVLEIFKRALYFPDRLRMYGMGWNVTKKTVIVHPATDHKVPEGD